MLSDGKRCNLIYGYLNMILSLKCDQNRNVCYVSCERVHHSWGGGELNGRSLYWYTGAVCIVNYFAKHCRFQRVIGLYSVTVMKDSSL